MKRFFAAFALVGSYGLGVGIVPSGSVGLRSMSLIEQAAKRLEQLRQTGVEVPDDLADTANLRPSPAVTVGPDRRRCQTVPVAGTCPAGQVPGSVQEDRADLDALAAGNFIGPNSPRPQLPKSQSPLIDNDMGRGCKWQPPSIPFRAPSSGDEHCHGARQYRDVGRHRRARSSSSEHLGLPPAKVARRPGPEESGDLSRVCFAPMSKSAAFFAGTTASAEHDQFAGERRRGATAGDMANRYSDRIIISTRRRFS